MAMPAPFSISVPEAELADLAQRLSLASARLPDEGPGGESWDYGIPRAALVPLLAFWRDEFVPGWRAEEARLNAALSPQYTMPVATGTSWADGEPLSVHFVHRRSTVEGAVPLLLLHGWPGSVWEFEHLFGPLTTGGGPGGAAQQQAFHVVAPSLPGYLFSEAPRTRGFDVAAVGRLMDNLMSQLGYSEYVVQGGDWGAVIARCMGINAAGRCKAIHVNMAIAQPPPGVEMGEEEKAAAQKRAAFEAVETGYQKIQGTKPQTLGYGLSDSPVGLLAWIAEKFHGWSDVADHTAPGGHGLTAVHPMASLLANVSLYWFSNCITSSCRLYFETLGPKQTGQAGPLWGQKVPVPCGIASFKAEPFAAKIRSWVEQGYNVRRWSEIGRGGHFAARENPAALLADLRAFVFEDLTAEERPAVAAAAGGSGGGGGGGGGNPESSL